MGDALMAETVEREIDEIETGRAKFCYRLMLGDQVIYQCYWTPCPIHAGDLVLLPRDMEFFRVREIVHCPVNVPVAIVVAVPQSKQEDLRRKIG